MKQANAGIVISGVIDGTTIAYDVIVVENDLTPTTITQYYSETEFVPDWADIWQNGSDAAKATLPRLVVKARDMVTGADLTRTVSITAVWYNGSQMTFGADGISTGTVMPGVLRLTTIQYGSYTVPCLQLVGNPASALLNPDSDRIEIDGTVVCDGGQVSFRKLGVDLPIRPLEKGTGGYSVELLVPSDVDKYIYTDPSTNQPVPTKRIAQLRLNNVPVGVEGLTGYSVKWYDITGPTEVELVAGTNIAFAKSKMTNDVITIKPDAVDSMMSFTAKVFGADNNLVAVGSSMTVDLTDPWQSKWTVKTAVDATEGTEYYGVKPMVQLHSGQKRYFFPGLYNANGDYPSKLTWTFNVDDATTGADISQGFVTGTDTAGNSYCIVSFSDVVPGGVARNIILNAQTNL